MSSQAGVVEGLAGRVREATARDLDRVAALWSAITDHHAPLDPLFRMRPEAGGELRELLGDLCRNPDAAIFVYEDAGDLPGMCIVRIDHSPPIVEEVDRAEITDLGVREEARRQGIGSQLLAAALAWIRIQGIERVQVNVAVGNAEGQAFWRRHGFAPHMDVLHKRL
ncbi:MAG: GNAT family N-acetyltransferase [Myxococcota bacterium]